MKAMRRIFTLATAVVVASAPTAGPAAAKAPKGAYVATIDCGSGAVVVGSGIGQWSTLVDVDSGTTYKPVAWHVSGEGFVVDELKKGESKRHAVDCSYTDGVVTGTVTVKKA